MRSSWNPAAAAVLLLVCVSLQAEPQIGRVAGRAQLRLTFDSGGGVSAHLIVFTLPDKPGLLELPVSQMIGFKLRDVDWDIDYGKHVIALVARSAGRLPHGVLGVRGELALAPLEKALAELKVPSLTINLVHPQCAFSHFGPATQVSLPHSPEVEYEYQIILSQGPSPNLPFDFGYGRRDMARAFSPLFLLMLVPLGLMARRRIGANPAASGAGSFEYLRFNGRLLVIAALLAWLLAFGLIFGSEADRVGFFMARLESEFSQSALVAGFVMVSGIILSLLNFDRILSGGSDMGSETGIHAKTKSLVWQAQAMLLLPTVFLAIAVVSWRNTNTRKATEWLAAGLLLLFGSLATFLWANSNALVVARSAAAARFVDGPAEDHRRLSCLRSWLGHLAAAVLIPALAVFGAGEWHLEDTPRYLTFFGALICAAGVTLAVDRFFPGSRRQKPLVSSALWIGTAGAAALGVCILGNFTFDFTQGDEGWAMLFLALTAAVFQSARQRSNQV